MNVVVKLFAGARELAGRDTLEVELPADARIGDLRYKLVVECPALASLLPHALFAVDATYASEETIICEHNEVACIPPVSGG